ncbi:MAG: tripartite tricarboxylate transporter TctB family protein [Rhodospirillales bacterium]
MQTGTTRLVIALAVCLLAAAGVFWLIPAQTGDARGPTDIAPAFFPTASLGICLVLGLLLLFQALRPAGPPAEGTASAEDSAGEEAGLTGRSLLTDLGLWIAFSVTTMLMLKYAGFIVTGILALAGWMWFCGQRSWIVIGLTSIGVPLLLYQLSWTALTIRLP